jgi:glutamate formiminotransferase
VALIDLRLHAGAHPRFGSVDVVPWVALARQHGRLVDADPALATAARDEFAAWAGRELVLPCFLYGPERSLPALRREAWRGLSPDCGPPAPHPSAGSVAVGVRPLLVAYNLWLADADPSLARAVAAGLRSSHVRTLGLQVGAAVQVSSNLIAPLLVGPGAVFDAVSSQAGVARAELVGLVPQAVLDAEPPRRWAELGLDPSATIEARLEKTGLDGGRFG